jgi:hypothetical protein
MVILRPWLLVYLYGWPSLNLWFHSRPSMNPTPLFHASRDTCFVKQSPLAFPTLCSTIAKLLGAKSRGAGVSKLMTFLMIIRMPRFSIAAFMLVWILELAAPILVCELELSKSRKILWRSC